MADHPSPPPLCLSEFLRVLLVFKRFHRLLDDPMTITTPTIYDVADAMAFMGIPLDTLSFTSPPPPTSSVLNTQPASTGEQDTEQGGDLSHDNSCGGPHQVKDLSPSCYLALMCAFAPIKVLENLIKSSVEANACFYEYSALDIAVMQGRADVVTLLIQRGALIHR